MSSSTEAGAGAPRARARSRSWSALVPLALLAVVVAAFATTGGPLLRAIGSTAPPLDEFDITRVELHPGTVRIHLRNPQQARLTIGSVTVDDAIVPYKLEGGATLRRLGTTTVVAPYDWVEGEPLSVGVTSSSGVQTTEEVAAAVESAQASATSVGGFALIGFLVGVVPVALGLLWLRPLRRADARWLAAFMALTGGLLTFLAFEALGEALELQAELPSALGGVGLVLLGVAASYLALTFVSARLSRRTSPDGGAGLSGIALATLIATGIGLHNLGEGLAIGSSFAIGAAALGTFLVLGFMIHNITEGLGIAAPIADGHRVSALRLALLAALAGAPAILGTWIGGFFTSDILGVVFFSIAVGAALQVVVEVARYVTRRAPGGLRSGYVAGGFVAGIAVMYATGLLTA